MEIIIALALGAWISLSGIIAYRKVKRDFSGKDELHARARE